MSKAAFIFLYFMFLACQSTSHLKNEVEPVVDFKSWNSAILNTFNKKTGYSSGVNKKIGTILEVVNSNLRNLSESKMQALLTKSKPNKKAWNRMFIIRQYIEGENNIYITSIFFYSESSYRGVSYDEHNYYKVKNINNFRIWETKADLEYRNNGYLIISEFDRKYNNISNEIFIGLPNYELENNILSIYDDSIFH